MTEETKPAEKPAEKVVVTDEQIVFVAKAMDIDNKLEWDSPDHDKQVAILNAKDDAKHMILGFLACSRLGEVPKPAEKPAEVAKTA